MRDEILQQAERKLRRYPQTIVRIRNLNQRLKELDEEYTPSVTASYERRDGAVYTVSNPVESAVLIREKDNEVRDRLMVELEKCAREAKLIEGCLASLSELDRQCVRYRYFNGYSIEDCAEKMSYSYSGFRARVRVIVPRVAWALGLVKEES